MKNIWDKIVSFCIDRCTRGKVIIILSSLLFLLFFWFSLPRPLFKTPTSTVIEDVSGRLLGAKIANDGQWRFPNTNKVPEKYAKSLIQFEDKRFYYHKGFDPIAFGRAIIQNFRSKKVISGGSTISMQVIRLARKNKHRTIFEKIMEVFLATRLELTYSKKEILALYASNAPFGSNVVGIDAAAWRYYGRPADMLSWAESVTLAVLPNSPSLIYPGKNHNNLLKKRNSLLDKLNKAGIIDSMTCALSKQEPLPGKPFPLPQLAPHLLDRTSKEGNKGKISRTTIDANIQENVNRIVEYHHTILKTNDINNIAVLVLDVESGNVISYVGNTRNEGHPEYNSDVDVVNARRSTGSILKPFLYAAMLSYGEILPNTLVPDIPTQIAGYTPQNYYKRFDGAVPAKRALARSLNIPSVRMLQKFGLERFNYVLKKIGMTTLDQPADHYGLSIILGGAEATLWDLAGIYASMARTLKHYVLFNARYLKADFHPPNYLLEKTIDHSKINPLSGDFDENSFLGAASIWYTFEAMVEVARPEEEVEWREFTSTQKIAWKTGTSYGNRDGWAIGVTSENVVAVWVGNADGEGRPGLTGTTTAAPVMFDVFKLLKNVSWFSKPFDDMSFVPVCSKSGYRASDICDVVDSMWLPNSGLKTICCPYHQVVHLDATGKWRVTSDCEVVSNMIHVPWFVLPPAQEWYYKSKNPDYKDLPPYRDDCISGNSAFNSMELIYPKSNAKIYVPIELDGTIGKTVFQVAHRRPQTTIYWHMDGEYLGMTTEFHQMELSPAKGKHILTLVDQYGETLIRQFEILGK
jgi:penicillin-binding protein 1C